MNKEDKAFLEHLKEFVSEHKKELFEQVLENRTKHITIALEDVYQSQNASAVVRSCDGFGIQDVHVIENKNSYKVNKDIARGSAQWLTLKKYNSEENNTKACIDDLRSRGYKIVATSPHADDVNLEDLPVDQPIALFFGTEKEGISPIVQEHADVFMKIPMHGFTESFNISVSAALCLHSLSNKIRRSDVDWHLTEEEKEEIRLAWCKSAVRNWEGHWQEFIRKREGV